MQPTETIRLFDAFLSERGLRFDAVVVGGTILNLLGIVSRPTKDCDVVSPTIPPSIAEASRVFARETRARGEALADDWLNNGPISIIDVLPQGWELRLTPAFNGASLSIRSLGRSDLLLTKLFALCDRGIDIGDCIALSPTQTELSQALEWVERQDANPDWPAHVRRTFADLSKRIGHGV